ncbi:MAG: ATP-grasp domain-containing protein [Mesorhizobium sp.]|uniref:ATP-grasp domain-containing protein n=1 Tax=Mesorhizobium sp. TaxID=1871066 RepID=UPI000FE6B3FE|nr:acetyl-CoA carboxylase biotin carboxylase subunit family protein [Mesorhizobium sp.]RWH31388.1 MAG: ATP-grasp domain-containing protein [Mesorhizobium sp.]RWH38626.1 MAG: ATP-grasp domain-containing protein [Mesorhizobium sp.]TIM70809.1 MAG: ATP-grasp domain-containing protein [Mesorhizobium sp.]TIO05210.1 MAG: ATP-grasp domain-containing protein [Mesorhizobium sp.]TIR58059.1 MAG: ATP-grasp domain-containing protein [Mesorhizobium sp.]
MATRALILVEGASNMLRYVQAAQRLALHPITLLADPAKYDYLAAGGIEVVRVDTDNLDALIHECSRLLATYDIAGITSAQESVYATVGKLCRYFDLPGPNPESIERCCDKFAQRQLLAEAGVPIPAYRVAANATDVERSAAEIGLPVILKPAVGIGSMGVRLCRNVDELAEHTTYLLGGKHIWASSPRILVEEFARGLYYCADIMGDEVIGIFTGDFGSPPHFVYREFTYPASLRDDEHKHIADVSLNCLQALGLGWGPTCIEFRWTELGPVVIEVNPRLAGAPTPQMVELAYGIDPVTEHIKLVIGEECNLRRRHTHTAAVRHLIADRDGTLDWIDGHSQAAAIPGVAEVKFYIEPKTPIVRKGDYRDCMGYVVATSPSLTETEAILQRAVDLIDWSITPFPILGE